MVFNKGAVKWPFSALYTVVRKSSKKCLTILSCVRQADWGANCYTFDWPSEAWQWANICTMPSGVIKRRFAGSYTMHDKFAPTFYGEELLASSGWLSGMAKGTGEHHWNIRHFILKSYMWILSRNGAWFMQLIFSLCGYFRILTV
jgi:hypothetical protein